MMRVIVTPKAERDLGRIADWIASDNPDRAITFLDELREACLGLAAFPARYPFVEGLTITGIRRRVHGNYLIFYRVEDEQIVRILHILHGAADYRPLLG